MKTDDDTKWRGDKGIIGAAFVLKKFNPRRFQTLLEAQSGARDQDMTGPAGRSGGEGTQIDPRALWASVAGWTERLMSLKTPNEFRKEKKKKTL